MKKTFGILITLALGLVLTSATLANSGPVTVQQTSVSGNNVQVVVHNSGSQTENSEVTVTAVVAGQQVQAQVPVTTAGGQSVGVTISFGNPIEEIQQVGIINDDSGPY